MADWTNLPNAAVGVGGLPSGTTVTALRDNPVAIAEGAPDAPRVEPVALAGKSFIAQISASSTNPAGFLDLDDVSEIRGLYSNGTSGSTGNFEVRFSDSNGASWGAWQTITLSFGGTTPGQIDLNLNIEDGRFSFMKTVNPSLGSGSLTLPSGLVNAVQFRNASNMGTWNLLGYITGGKSV